MDALRKTLPAITEWLDLKRPRLQFVSVKRLLRRTVPELAIVSICTSAVRPMPRGTRCSVVYWEMQAFMF